MKEKCNIFLIFILIQFSSFSSSSRDLQEINNICNKIENKFTSPQITAKEFLKNNNYNFEKEKNYPKSNKLYDFLIGKKLEEEYDVEHILIIKKYLLNWYMLPLLLLWIIFGILFYTKKCLFKSDIKFELISKFSTIIIIIILALMLICSVFVLNYTKDLQSSINDACCNLLKFFYELNHGRIKEKNHNLTKIDRWPGLFGLNSILIDTSEAVIKISKKLNNTFSSLNEIKKDIENYQDSINILINKTSEGIINPNPINNEGNINPIYLYEFNDILKQNSIINEINNEYINYFLNPLNKIDFIYDNIKNLSIKSDVYYSLLNNIFENISDYCDIIKDKSSNITNNIIIFQRNSEFIILFMKIINIFCISLSIIIFGLVIMLYFRNLSWIKISLHASWNLLFFLLILYISIYYFIFNLSDGVKHSIYLLENKVLNTDNNLFFDTCLNTEESDLNLILNVYNNNSALIEIDNYYKNIFPVLSSLDSLEKEYPFIKQIKRALAEINLYLNNYELTTNSSYGKSDISYILNEISSLTNNSYGKREGYCDTNDIWVSSKNKCKDNIYISRYEIKDKFIRKIKEKYCFTIQDDFKEKDLEKIYGNVCSDKAYKKLVMYITSLTKFYDTNLYLLESIEQTLEDIERYNKKLSEIIISQIKVCKDDLGDLIDIFKPILGDSNITNLFKCERLKKKIINFYDICYNLISNDCHEIKKDVLRIILLGLLGIIFIIINNYRNSNIVKRRYMKLQHKDLNNDGVELIEEVPGEDEDN